MDNKSFFKATIMLGGGFLLFWLLKPKGIDKTKSAIQNPLTASFDATKPVTPEQKANGRIVMDAYQSAMMAGEPPMILSELNRECMKDYGMKCYQKKDGTLCVTDEAGREIVASA